MLWFLGRVCIHDVKKLEKILPNYYRHSKISSFRRQLTSYGFLSIDGEPYIYANDDTTEDINSILSLKRKKKSPRSNNVGLSKRHSNKEKKDTEPIAKRRKTEKLVKQNEKFSKTQISSNIESSEVSLTQLGKRNAFIHLKNNQSILDLDDLENRVYCVGNKLVVAGIKMNESMNVYHVAATSEKKTNLATDGSISVSLYHSLNIKSQKEPSDISESRNALAGSSVNPWTTRKHFDGDVEVLPQTTFTSADILGFSSNKMHGDENLCNVHSVMRNNSCRDEIAAPVHHEEAHKTLK